MPPGRPDAADRSAPSAGTNPIIVAIDVPDLDQAVSLASRLEGEVGMFKVGLELFGGYGPAAVERIAEYGPVFLDLKLHDIPTTVERATRRLSQLDGVEMLTIHATGGPTMVAAAVEGFGDAGTILAVTVLTSLSDEELARVNMPPADTQVEALAFMAVDAGAPGLVCAPRDLGRVRSLVGSDVAFVTPGIRPAGEGDDDHARAATPTRAMDDGATHLVIGRPITRADDPVAAARAILADL
ncbi:MAG: orotidine-5'-phosphate decarboxylase [Actinobacteria bacterium]|nr:orotidine-5'-phosphate decarboxylase [Actinomycetota bacterium]